MRTGLRWITRLCLAITVAATLLPGVGQAAAPEGTYTLTTRGVAVMRSGIPYQFSIFVTRSVTSTSDQALMTLDFIRKKSNGAVQKHRWVYNLQPDDFAVGNYPNVILDAPLVGGRGSINMKFMPETSQDSCGGMINTRIGDLVSRGANGGLNFITKNAFFGKIARTRFTNAKLVRDSGCMEFSDDCPDASRLANAFGDLGNGGTVRFGGIVFPDRGKARLSSDVTGPYGGADPGDPPTILHQATAPVPPLYVEVAEDLSSATLTGKAGTFFSGIGTVASTNSDSGSPTAPCGGGTFQPTYSTVQATSTDGDLKVTWDGFSDPSMARADDGNLQKLELVPIP
jgi:hypothetical protein